MTARRSILAMVTACFGLGLFGPDIASDASPIYAIGAPIRPTESSQLHVTAGLFVNYGIVADPNTHVVAERLTIWDAVQGRDVVFSVGPAATIDGVPISCRFPAETNHSFVMDAMKFEHMCSQLPVKVQAGHTWLTLVWWTPPKPKNDLLVRDTYPGTDEIHTLIGVSLPTPPP